MLTILVSDRHRSNRSGLNLPTTIRKRLADFLFSPDSDHWLTLLRLGLGFQVVLYCLSLRTDWNQLFSGDGSGFVSRDLTEAVVGIGSPLVPRLGWLISPGKFVGLNEQVLLSSVWILLLVAGCCLLLGFFCRSSAILAWFLHLSAIKSGDFLAYGMDNFTTIGLFYLMVSPLPDRYALDWKLWRLPDRDPRTVGFFRRVLQIHLCVIYFFGGLTKCLGVGWWTGASMWRALTRPPFDIVPTEVLVSFQSVLPMVGIVVCLIETGYPIFIWPKRTRVIWLTCILGMHIAIGLTMGLYLFSVIMIVLNVAAFGPEIIFSKFSGDGFAHRRVAS